MAKALSPAAGTSRGAGGRIAGTGEGDRGLASVMHDAIAMSGDAIGGAQIAEQTRIGGRGRDLGQAYQFEVALEGVEVFSRTSEAGGRIAAGSGKNASGGIDGAQNHFLGATATRDDTDPGFHQSHVQLGMGLAAGGVQRDLRSSSQAETKRRHHHRPGAEPIAAVMR